jgi:hypothetical protein
MGAEVSVYWGRRRIWRVLASAGIILLFALGWQGVGEYQASPPEPASGADTVHSAKATYTTVLFPYAQQPNQCGGANWSRLVPERPLCFGDPKKCKNDFTDACNRHDLCYMDLSKSRKECDSVFLMNLLQTCTNNPTGFGRVRCRILAKLYYRAVARSDAHYFMNSRDRQALYENHLRRELASPVQTASPPAAPPQNVGQLLK